jgi:hypothetical protein
MFACAVRMMNQISSAAITIRAMPITISTGSAPFDSVRRIAGERRGHHAPPAQRVARRSA